MSALFMFLAKILTVKSIMLVMLASGYPFAIFPH